MSTLRDYLEVWESASTRPHEVLKEFGMYDNFMDILASTVTPLLSPIYRGTCRHGDLRPGDLLEYTYPSSWTKDESIAFRFIEEDDTRVILEYDGACIRGVFNKYNSYGESEIILYPITFKVIHVFNERDYTRVILE